MRCESPLRMATRVPARFLARAALEGSASSPVRLSRLMRRGKRSACGNSLPGQSHRAEGADIGQEQQRRVSDMGQSDKSRVSGTGKKTWVSRHVISLCLASRSSNGSTASPSLSLSSSASSWEDHLSSGQEGPDEVEARKASQAEG
jgi:hypothetical protein